MKSIGTDNSTTIFNPRKLLAFALLGVLPLSGCKLGISVFEGGSVESTSGAYECTQGNACVVEIKDMNFHETFMALPATGYEFVQWTKGDGFHCGGSKSPMCLVDTTQHIGNVDMEALIAGDTYMYLQPKFKYVGGGSPPPIGSGGSSLKACMTSPTRDFTSDETRIIMRNGAVLNNYNGWPWYGGSEYLMHTTSSGDWYAVLSWANVNKIDVTQEPTSCFEPSLLTVTEVEITSAEVHLEIVTTVNLILSDSRNYTVEANKCLPFAIGDSLYLEGTNNTHDYIRVINLKSGSFCDLSF